MTISPLDVKALRDKTGAGMADCKKALEESHGDMEAAIEYLRKKGAAVAAKRADKAANEGVVATAVAHDKRNAAIVEVNCETDFVARNEEFNTFAKKLAFKVLAHNPKTQDELESQEIEGKTVRTWLDELLGKFSERIEVKRFAVFASDSGFVTDYVHNGEKLGVLLELTDGADQEKAAAIARDIAMQVAAMNPSYVHRGEVPDDVITKEKEIYAELTAKEGKKPEIAEKIVASRLEKFFADFCLVEQSFVKDSSLQVRDVLTQFSKEIGRDINITRFVRFNLGETAPAESASA